VVNLEAGLGGEQLLFIFAAKFIFPLAAAQAKFRPVHYWRDLWVKC